MTMTMPSLLEVQRTSWRTKSNHYDAVHGLTRHMMAVVDTNRRTDILYTHSSSGSSGGGGYECADYREVQL